MTFDARTAEIGGVQWNLQRAIDAVERAIQFIKEGHCGASHTLDLVYCGLRDAKGSLEHIIAPEPEAKPAVPEKTEIGQTIIGRLREFTESLEAEVAPENEAICTVCGTSAIEGFPLAPAENYGGQPGNFIHLICPSASTRREIESQAKLRSDLASRDETIERLNQMIRDTGQGQGAIDAYVAQCEDMERKDETIKRLEGENKEYLQKIFLMYHAAGICDGSDEIESVKRLKADRDTLQSDNARLTADLSAARERVTVLEAAATEILPLAQILRGPGDFAESDREKIVRFTITPKKYSAMNQLALAITGLAMPEATLSGSVEDA